MQYDHFSFRSNLCLFYCHLWNNIPWNCMFRRFLKITQIDIMYCSLKWELSFNFKITALLNSVDPFMTKSNTFFRDSVPKDSVIVTENVLPLNFYQQRTVQVNQKATPLTIVNLYSKTCLVWNNSLVTCSLVSYSMCKRQSQVKYPIVLYGYRKWSLSTWRRGMHHLVATGQDILWPTAPSAPDHTYTYTALTHTHTPS